MSNQTWTQPEVSNQKSTQPTVYNQTWTQATVSNQRGAFRPHLAFLSNTAVKLGKKFSLASVLEGTVFSKVGSTLSNALLLTGSDRVSIAVRGERLQREIRLGSHLTRMLHGKEITPGSHLTLMLHGKEITPGSHLILMLHGKAF